MSITQEIINSWGWIGIEPIEVVEENYFGNLIIKDVNQQYWRLCPEDVYCEIVAQNRAELDELSQSQNFLEDWEMKNLVQQAKDKCGVLTEGNKYCLVIPGILGGAYDTSNIKIAPLLELVRFSGYVAKQIKDLPDGAEINLKVVP
ncbi:MAG: DUF1851 domain-containing protein [Psychrobium sp.]|nr:DUF1851 domain-containing protein [Psychrobium sp.]